MIQNSVSSLLLGEKYLVKKSQWKNISYWTTTQWWKETFIKMLISKIYHLCFWRNLDWYWNIVILYTWTFCYGKCHQCTNIWHANRGLKYFQLWITNSFVKYEINIFSRPNGKYFQVGASSILVHLYICIMKLEVGSLR